MELKALEILKNLHSDIIDGIESGVNSEEEKAEVFECIEELEELENRNCENCKYYNNTQVCDIFIARSGNKSNDFFCNKWVTK